MKQSGRRVALGLAALAGLGAGLGAQSIEYRVTYVHEPAPARWEVQLSARGLDPDAGEVSLSLPNWGEWTEVDSYFLKGLAADPPVRRDGRTDNFHVDVPDGWKGSLELSYLIMTTELGTNAKDSHGILPYRSHDYCLGFSENTLMRVLQNGENPEAERTITFVAPRGWTIATGWGGLSKSKQMVELDQPIDNCIIAFGKPVGLQQAKKDGVSFEVVEFGAAKDVTEQVLDLARTLVPLYGETTGKKMDKPVRIFITDTGGGGVRTDYGLGVGFSVDNPGYIDSPYYKNTVAHELFHDWLGGYLQPDGKSLVWFFEGFTDYFSLWYLARTGLVTKQWFAERMLELERDVERNPAYAEARFADPSTPWREGANEDVAYKGGALLALAMDAELRKNGHAGLIELIRDLLQENDGVYSQESLRGWMLAHGLEDFYTRHVDGTERVSAAEALESIGFVRTERDAVLTYFGLRTDRGGDTGLGRVVEVDPEGPTAERVQVGDVITGYYCIRKEKPHIRSELETRFRFGLDLFEPDVPGTFFGIKRGEEDIKIELVPRSIPGGYLMSLGADEEALAAFFR